MRPYSHRSALLVAAILAGLTFFGSFWIQQRIDPVVFEYGNTNPDSAGYLTTNIWFDGDLPKIKTLTDNRFAELEGFAAKHPLVWPASWFAVELLQRAGVEQLTGLRLLTALTASLWSLAIFGLMYRITGRLLDATLLSLLSLVSASALFWGIVPEVFLPGSLTIVAALYLPALAEKQFPSTVSYVVIGAATLGVTVTNWMVGILATVVCHPWRKALQISVNVFALMSLLWGVQKLVIPNSAYFLIFNEADRRYILDAASGGPLKVASAFFLHTVVMPQIEVASTVRPLWQGMTVQGSLPGSGSAIGIVAVLLWAATLVAGAYGLIVSRRYPKLQLVVGASLLLQLLLHLVYGREIFLYSMHFLPLLIAMAAFGTLTRKRPLVLGVIGATIVAAAWNNWGQLERALSIVRDIAQMSSHGT